MSPFPSVAVVHVPDLLSGLAGAMIGATASLAGVLVTQHFARRREDVEYSRRLRDEKRERLRAAYLRMGPAAETVKESGRLLAMRSGYWATKERRRRLVEEIRRATAELEDVMVVLGLESETEVISSLWFEKGNDFWALGDIDELVRGDWQPNVADHLDRVIEGVLKLEDAAR